MRFVDYCKRTLLSSMCMYASLCWNTQFMIMNVWARLHIEYAYNGVWGWISAIYTPLALHVRHTAQWIADLNICSCCSEPVFPDMHILACLLPLIERTIGILHNNWRSSDLEPPPDHPKKICVYYDKCQLSPVIACKRGFSGRFLWRLNLTANAAIKRLKCLSLRSSRYLRLPTLPLTSLFEWCAVGRMFFQKYCWQCCPNYASNYIMYT